MNSVRLIFRSLVYYRRTNAGVVAGAAVATAVLTGALVLGDSVRRTLRKQALDRIGSIDAVLSAGDRFFRSDLSDRLQGVAKGLRAAPILQLRSVVSTPASGQTAQRVNTLGVDDRFVQLALTPLSTLGISGNQCLLNARLASHLNATPGDELIIRVRTPNALAPDSVLAAVQNNSQAFRVEIAGVLSDESFGRFSLTADQIPPFNLYVRIDWLQEQLNLPDRANVLLLDTTEDVSVEQASDLLDDVLQPGDYQLRLGETLDPHIWEYRSERIFIGPEVERAVSTADVPTIGVLTYFVNEIEFGDQSTPYSMVAAIGPLGGDATLPSNDVLPDDLKDNEIVINEWLSDDLGCDVGDTLSLRYFVTDEQDRLLESTNAFTVRSITPMQGLAADRTLMPDFPGIAEAEAGRDWDPGIPLNLNRLRDKDEQYWEDYRGTPKAFVTRNAGLKMWSNRYGSLTAIRFHRDQASAVANAIISHTDPSALGFVVQDVRTPALRASQATTDFGGLFLALSFFLIFASLLLMGLLFVFNIEQRARELGTMLVMGFTSRAAGRLLWTEGALLAFIGAAIGIAAGVGYTRLVLAALAGIWSNAVASASIGLFVSPLTLLISFTASVLGACLVMRLTLGRMARKEAVDLLNGGIEFAPGARTKRGAPIVSTAIGALSLIPAFGIVASVGTASQSATAAFFGAGALLLIGGIAMSRVAISRLNRATVGSQPSLSALALRNTARRLNRSTVTVSLLALGVFLVVGISGSQLDPNRNADDRKSGTGGFAFIAETSLPVSFDLNESRGRDAFGLTDEELAGVSFVPMRVRDGDDASCLNLNLPQNPRLLGVDPEALDERGSFSFAKLLPGLDRETAWKALAELRTDGAIPAIADDASATWAMHKAVGDTLEYTDEHGETFSIVIVATIENSILQGNLLISDDYFRALFPSEIGDRLFLIDAPPADRESVASRLSNALFDVGLELTPAAQRLAQYSAVQNTYLVIFQMLGALGLLLGTVGLGIVVVRNLLERRAELAMLRVVGFDLADIRRFVVTEHALLLILGLLCGSLAALLALLPALAGETVRVPILFVALMLLTLLVSGLLWIWLATRLAVSDSIVRDLQGE